MTLFEFTLLMSALDVLVWGLVLVRESRHMRRGDDPSARVLFALVLAFAVVTVGALIASYLGLHGWMETSAAVIVSAAWRSLILGIGVTVLVTPR